MNNTAVSTIESSLKECDSHLEKCRRARTLLEQTFPLTPEGFENLDEDTIEHIDQLVYRFTKMQDSMGSRLLPSLYSYIEAEDAPKPFLTILSRLEKLKVLTSAELWQFFRNLRNNLAHDYPESIDQTTATLNLLNNEFEKFEEMYTTVRTYWRSMNS